MKRGEAARIGSRSFCNLVKGWPLCVSFEVTHSCVADCVHCDKGGLKQENGLMAPADYHRFSEELLPPICQLSGGEPLLRPDLEDIIRAVKRESGLPMVVVVSNWWLMTEQRYLSLQEAGAALFSVSLDFPDERHDDFRRVPGLFAKLNEIIPYLVKKYQRDDIVLNTALTRANFAEIPGLVAQAEEWGVQISFSAYSPLRTGDQSLCIREPEDLALLRDHFAYLKKHRRQSSSVLNSDYILDQTYRYFAEGGLKGCQAGRRFLVVRPDGRINACSMFPDLQYGSREEAVEGFKGTREQCDQCYVSIRASTERSLSKLFTENVGMAFRLPGSPN